jgi:hypothetical protein
MNKSKELYEYINYTADISYLTNTFITEYDISKANINVLYLKGVIDKPTYDYLYQSERMVRQKFVGMLQRDNKEVTKALQSGIIEAKKALFEANDIQDHEILMILNDAVFVINRQLQNTNFGMIQFMPKNIYTSFYRVNTPICKMDMLYYYSNINKEEYLDIKGLSDNVLPLHENAFYQALKDIFYSVQIDGVEVAMRMLKDIYMQYINLQLPVEYYRKFDNESQYHFKLFSRLSTGYTISQIDDSIKPMLDITYNLQILLEIQKILVSLYFNR